MQWNTYLDPIKQREAMLIVNIIIIAFCSVYESKTLSTIINDWVRWGRGAWKLNQQWREEMLWAMNGSLPYCFLVFSWRCWILTVQWMVCTLPTKYFLFLVLEVEVLIPWWPQERDEKWHLFSPWPLYLFLCEIWRKQEEGRKTIILDWKKNSFWREQSNGRNRKIFRQKPRNIIDCL